MATNVAIFRIRFPEFEDSVEFPDARIQLFLDDAVNIYIGTDELRWSGKYDISQAYIAAHLLTIATTSEAGSSNSKAGTISSKSAGGVSVGYNVVAKDRSDSDSFFVSTTYGQQYIIIRNTTFAGVLIAR
tara:strand:+ start:849 stop:1238 length:390 start_codon:yes stop_codon:yes gene_type:complete